ncbi:hypothetical protein TELCIR_03889, partial [Teladorsagia circumcincta]
MACKGQPQIWYKLLAGDGKLDRYGRHTTQDLYADCARGHYNKNAMTTLSLLVEGSACAWGRLAIAHGSETINDVIRALISFANAHLSMSALNQLLLFAFANKIKKR